MQLFKYLITGIILLFCMPVNAQVDWYETFNSTYPADIPTVPNLGWSESYTMRAYISMYRVSVARGESQAEQQKWLTYLTNHCSYVINNNLTEEDALVKAGHGYTPIARFVRMVFDDSLLYTTYGNLANTYLNYIETVIIPHWRNYPYWKDPFNWYCSYGNLLLNLQQLTRTIHYKPPYYQTPDTSLANYYYQSVKNITDNFFQDFSAWTYTGPNWQWAGMQYPHQGLCYVPPPSDAYIWRYWDDGDYLTFYGWDSQQNAQGPQITEPITANEWYYLEITRPADSIKLKMYDSTGLNLIFMNEAPWDSTYMFTTSDLYIGRNPVATNSSYLEGILDEVKFYKNNNLVAWWPFEGNADDISGNGHNGTLNGNTSWVTGKVGQALEFSYGYVLVPHQPDLNNFDKIELWVKFYDTSPKYYNYILGKSTGFPDSLGFNLYVDAYRRAEDIGHANIDVEFLTEIACDSLFSSSYSQQKLHRFSNTFKNVLWSNSDITNPTFRGWLDPTASDNIDHTIRWLWLYKYDTIIGKLVNNWYVNHQDYLFEEPIANLACWQNGLFVDDCNEFTTGIPEIITSANDLYVYPNPASEIITINISNVKSKNMTLDIYNIMGTLERKEILRSSIQKINVADLSNGVYFITIKSGEFIKTKKLIITR
ncbi:MAG: T9SS type A sorting domain-containing protein [Bacteroidia bacterium]|nr:T9SS type A sorting domain-containing protein [Bacteroidia bacterium]